MTLKKKSLKAREKSSIEVIFSTENKVCKTYEAIFVGYLNIASNVIYLLIDSFLFLYFY